MKNLLIITTGFPPINNISARRFGGMVEYMEEFGWRPWIVTLESKGSLPVNIPETQIVRIGEATQVDDRLAEAEFKSLPRSIGYLRTIIHRHGLKFRSVDRSLLNWYRVVKSKADSIDNFGKMDAVLASYGPASALWLGRYFSSRYQIPWVADFRDIGAIRDDHRTTIARQIDLLIEGYLLKSTAGIITVGNCLTELLRTHYDKPIKAIFNGYWFSRQQMQNAPSLAEAEYPSKFVYYAGQFYDHQLAALEVFLKSIKMNDELKFVIRSTGPAAMDRKVLDLIKRIGVEDTVKIWPACSPEKVIYEAQMAVCNLVVEDLNSTQLWSRGTITGKLLELLILEPPILAVARSDSEIGSILCSTEKGRLFSTESEVTAFLCKLIGGNQFSPNTIEIESYSKRSQCMKLCRFLDEITIVDP